MRQNIERRDILEKIAESSIFGNLGLFIGAGLSMAIMNDLRKVALSWEELVEKAVEKLEINQETIDKVGSSWPTIVTKLCETYSAQAGVEYTEAATQFKRQIANLTNWYPEKEKQEIWGEYVSQIDPTWIITTNYDLILECLLTGKSISLGPNDQLVKPKGMIPIYHLHGIRTDPESLIITSEDYVGLFRPNEYRQIKLVLILKESTTLIIGYRLDDVNVLTAVDWSRKVFSRQTKLFPQEIIQVIRIKNHKSTPYRDKNNIIIVETDELSNFFDDLCDVIKKRKALNEARRKELNQVLDIFKNPDEKMVASFISDSKFREEVIDMLSKSEDYLIPGFLEYLSKCFDETWKRSWSNGAFSAYNENLNILLDILKKLEPAKMPPAVFALIIYQFESVSRYIGSEVGKGWDAHNTWETRKNEIPRDTVEEILSYAKNNELRRTIQFFTELRDV